MNWRHYIPILIAVCGIVGVAIVATRPPEPPEVELKWYKGNTHTHSLWSDGNDYPDMIVAWYKEQGYDFLALSDHNVLSRGERWMKVADVEKRRQVKEGVPTTAKYVARFGAEWVERRGEGDTEEVRLKTLEEIRPKFEEEEKFLLVEAEEITDRFRDQQVHINAVNLAEVIPPQKGASAVETIRNNLQAVEAQAERLGRPILAHINHPNFRWSLSARELAEVIEEQFFEVYNGHPGINHLGDGTRPGDERLWDLANAIRMKELNAPPLYGVATDDSHYYHGGNVSPGRGWVMVKAAKLEAGALVEAMKRGDFYASSGVELEDVRFEGGEYVIKIKAQEGVTYSTRFIGLKKGEDAEPGVELMEWDGDEPTYKMRGDELYVRAVVTSSRAHPNPSFKDQKEQAWTQPVGW